MSTQTERAEAIGRINPEDIVHLTLCEEGDHPLGNLPCCLTAVCGAALDDEDLGEDTAGLIPCPICHEWGDA